MYYLALDGYEKAFGPDHPRTLGITNNLCGLYGDQGKLDKAKRMFERTLAGYEKTLGPDHTSML
jgi:hypothetical protein